LPLSYVIGIIFLSDARHSAKKSHLLYLFQGFRGDRRGRLLIIPKKNIQMKTAVFSVRNYEKDYLLLANSRKHQLSLLDEHLSDDTVNLASGCKAVSLFVSDDASAAILEKLHALGVHFIALRSAGFDNVDMEAARRLKMKVARVPSYSPHAVAEHAVALMLALNRKLISAHQRIWMALKVLI
jgi:lactate dehydrogenase-like 2-hydroxyacid dehydrogenase